MNTEDVKSFIVETISRELSSRGLKVKKLILFGSRARGEVHKGSDWDFLAVTDKPVDWSMKRDIWYSLSEALARKDVSADVLIKSEDEFIRDKDDKGKVTYYAVKEGASV
jgi:predicted nucleotidyltransferase